MSRNSLTARTTPDFQLGPFFETDPTRIRNFYRIFSHKGDYFILRPSCQATPFDRIKCGFIRPVFVNANDKTNIKANLPLPTNSYFFHLMVSVMWPEHSLIKLLHASTPVGIRPLKQAGSDSHVYRNFFCLCESS